MVTSDWWLGIRVSPWGVPSTDSGKLCSNEKLGIRNGGAAHKNNEAPRNINRAMPEDGISVTSH